MRLEEEAQRGSRAGLTLLELLITLVLISVVATLAIPAFYGRPEVTLDRATLLLVRDLRLAQNEAVRGGKDVIFELRADGDGYFARYADGSLVPSPAGGLFDRVYSRDAVFEGVRLGRVQLGGPSRAIRFDRLGFAHGAGGIELEYRGLDCLVLVQESSGALIVRGLSRPELLDG